MMPEREIFWNIEWVWLFYLGAAVAVGIFLAGLAAHISVWRKSVPAIRVAFSAQALKKTLSDVFLGLRVLKGEIPAGIMHACIFWGFIVLLIGTTLLVLHEHIFPFLKGNSHLVFELCMEIGGLILLVGLLWALVRRYLQRVPRLERRMEDAFVPVLLLIVVLTGFVLEGLRLAAQQPAWAHWSFAGFWLAGLFSPSSAEAAYPYLWWIHALLSLGFIAVIPYTKLFHVLGAPAAYYLHHAPETPKEAAFPEEGSSEAPLEADAGEPAADADDFGFGEVPLTLREMVFYDACMQCGRCVQACPSAGAVEPFAPRTFIQATLRKLWQEHSRVGDIRFLAQDQPMDNHTPWYCTTCAACLEVCPVYGAAFEAVFKSRTSLIMDGTGVPDLMNQTLEKLFNYDNPWVASRRERAVWAQGLDIPALKRGAKAKPLCYFVGCTTSIDARAQGIARSFSAILKRAGLDFGILGDKEPCCGDIARVAGETGLFIEKRENCAALFDDYGIEEVVTSSPHCFHTFSNEYPDRSFAVRHYVLVLQELISDGRLSLKRPVNARVTFHDPCYLGRHNRIFEAPRKVLSAIPGIALTEMRNHGPNSLCCGGGGGRMWQGQDLRGETRMGEIRIKEAGETGAEILVTACPLCLIMLEDALKTVGLDGRMKVMDMNELILEALE